MHLRLRFQNLGKPRTAGLCGRAAGACDCGPLSCAKIERPSPLEKPSCKVRFFVQNRSRKYRQKVTATTLSPTVSHPVFQLRSQTAHVRFHRRKRVHTRLRSKDRTQRPTRRNRGAFRIGCYHYPRRVPHVHKHPRAGCQNGKLCRFWVLAGCTLEERREPSEQRCAYARRCPAGVAAPLGCVICLQLGDVAVFSLCAQYFLNVRGGGGITTLGAFHTVRKPCVARAQNSKLCRFLRLGSLH